MVIDWKYLATTTGYKSLKAVYIKNVQDAAKRQRPIRDKAEYLRQFQWVINRAKHYSYHTGESIETILNEWEEKRTYCWLNYYQDCGKPRFHSKSMRPVGLRYAKRHHTKQSLSDKMIRIAKENSTKTKPRWDTARKKRGF